jgi:RimJ/RimL family protein N-acetyltransferase
VSRIRLELLSRSHLEALAALAGDPGVQQFTRVPAPPPPGFAETWYGRYETGRRDGTREAFAICDDETDFLGVAVAPVIDRATRTAELGYVVVPEARGRGIATGALGLLTEWGLADLGALRLELLISVENNASKRVAERCGYIREGVLRSVFLKQELRGDTEIWSRLPTDPAPAREPGRL